MTDNASNAQLPQVKVKPLEWERYWPGCYTVKSLKESDNGCDVTYFAERAKQCGVVVNTVMKPGYFRCWVDWGEEYTSLEQAKAAVEADYTKKILDLIEVPPAPENYEWYWKQIAQEREQEISSLRSSVQVASDPIVIWSFLNDAGHRGDMLHQYAEAVSKGIIEMTEIYKPRREPVIRPSEYWRQLGRECAEEANQILDGSE